MSQTELDKAVEDVKKLSKKPSNDELLKLYGLYKQSTVGDNNTSRPGMFDIKGQYKWDIWNAYKGKNKETAEKEYITLVRQLQSKL